MLGEAIGSGDHWHARFMRIVGRLYLTLSGYKRIETLPALTQADLRTAIGWPLNADELLARESIRGQWLVAGQVVEEEERLTVQRTWLLNMSDGRRALVLHFAASMQPLDKSLVAGTTIEAELVYAPSAWPLRAIVKQRTDRLREATSIPGLAIEAALDGCATALSLNPWLERWPMALSNVVFEPNRSGRRLKWRLRDVTGAAVLIPRQWRDTWRLMSIAGGRPAIVFGEWDGGALNATECGG